MQQLILFLHILICISLVVLILIQHGKGADVGAAFGGGASQTIFGSQGSGSFLVKVTSVLAAVFFITSLSLGYLQTQQVKRLKNLELPATMTQQQPVKQLGQDTTKIL